MKQLLERSVVVVIAVSLAVFVMPVADTFGQSVPAAVSASKVRTTAGTPFDYTVTFTVRATRANICDIEIQLADPWIRLWVLRCYRQIGQCRLAPRKPTL
jgi:hypothetical protein